MARASVRGGGVEVEGLAESIRALRKFSKEAGREAVDIFRDEAKEVQKKAKRRVRGSHPSAPSSTSWIGRSATGKGAGVKLTAKGGDYRAHATEWGRHLHQYKPWNRTDIWRIPQRLMRVRTFNDWSGNQFDVKGSGPGYVIQPTIRQHLPGMEERVADRLSKLLRRILDREGVPRG